MKEVAPKNKGGRPKGSKNGHSMKLRRKLEPNPDHVELVQSGKSTSESLPVAPLPDVYEGIEIPGTPWVHTKKAQSLRKTFPIAWKWPAQKFWHAVVYHGDHIRVDLETGDHRAIPLTIDRGVGSPVNILLGKPLVIPDEIVEAIKDMTTEYPIVLNAATSRTAFENANGINGFELRSRYKIMVTGPATPEEYEAGAKEGPKRR